jgi:hypothetical protein
LTIDYSFLKKIKCLALTIFKEMTTYKKFKFFKEILGNSYFIQRIVLTLFFSKSGFYYPSQLFDHQNLEKAQLIVESEITYNFLNSLEGIGRLPLRDDELSDYADLY